MTIEREFCHFFINQIGDELIENILGKIDTSVSIISIYVLVYLRQGAVFFYELAHWVYPVECVVNIVLLPTLHQGVNRFAEDRRLKVDAEESISA